MASSSTSLPIFQQKDYQSDVESDLCAGCGDFGISKSLHDALYELGLPPWRYVVVSGIGCFSKDVPHQTGTNGIHTLHGRAIPYATGVKISNPNLEVIIGMGDGDCYGIGAGHFTNAGRKNIDMMLIVANNGVYGLTKGQASPTLGLGEKSKSNPDENINSPINPLATALASGYTFVARTFAYDVKYQKEIFKKAITHRGMALIDVLQDCPTYNHGYYDKNVLYKLDGENFDPVVKKKMDESGYEEETNQKLRAGIEKALEWNTLDKTKKKPTGIFYQNEGISIYEDRLAERTPAYSTMPPARQIFSDSKGKPTTDISKILEELRVI